MSLEEDRGVFAEIEGLKFQPVKNGNQEAIKSEGLAVEQEAKTVGGSEAIFLLEKLITRYKKADLFKDAARVEQAISSHALAAKQEMRQSECVLQITNEELNKVLNELVGHSLDEGLSNIAQEFLIKPDLIQGLPLHLMAELATTNSDGSTAAKIKDPEGESIWDAKNKLNIYAPLLDQALQQLRNRYSLNTEVLVTALKRSPFFLPASEPFIKKGIDAWFAGDAVQCIHILVPQIEAALREILSNAGGSITKENRSGLEFIGLGAVLSHALFPENLKLHFSALYSDTRGINLRNNLVHGRVEYDKLNMDLDRWVIHSFILISGVRL